MNDKWVMVRNGDDDIVRRMTAVMREADKSFASVGGSTRHYVRDCLLPILAKHGMLLSVILQEDDNERQVGDGSGS